MKKRKNRSQEGLLSYEELSMLNAEIRNSGEDRSTLPPHDTSDRANAWRFVKKNPWFIVCMAVILLAVIGTMIFGGIMLAKHLASRPNTSSYTIYLGEEEYEMPYDEAVRDGILYVDARKIAEFAGMIVSGTDTQIKFTASDEHYLRFENNNELAVINGSRVEMSRAAVVTKDVCLVPFSFLQKAVSQGLRLKLYEERNVIKVTRQLYKDSTDPAELLFVTDGFTVLQSIKPAEKIEIAADAYPIDISPYLAYIEPKNANDYLILANKQSALSASYEPSDLVSLEDIGISAKNNTLTLRRDAAYALLAMMQAMAAESPDALNDLFVTSAYRNYAYQEELYNGYVSDYIAQGMSEAQAIAEASKTSARPGQSEHQTGLCLDFIIKGQKLDESFENTLAFAWLRENAHLYGFILRYPSDKVSVTEYDYEPWHYRFVGRETAVKIHNAGLCLEEYLELN